MQATLNYQSFILANPLLSFHPGGLMNTAVTLRYVPGLKPDSLIVDYGCGTGLTLMMLSKLNYTNLIGFDTNRAFINSAIYRFSQELVKPLFISDPELLAPADNIHIIILESIFPFLDQLELDILVNRIDVLKQKHGAKYLMVTELYCKSDPSLAFIEKAKELYSIDSLRSLDEVKSILSTISSRPDLLFFETKEFVYNDTPVEYTDNSREDLFLEKIIGENFDSVEEAKAFRMSYAGKIKQFSREFCEKMQYCNAILQLD